MEKYHVATAILLTIQMVTLTVALIAGVPTSAELPFAVIMYGTPAVIILIYMIAFARRI